MGVIKAYAQATIEAGAFEPLDQVYVENKIRALVGDEDVPAKAGKLVPQLVELAVQRGKIEAGQTAREILNDQLYDLMTPTPSAVNHAFWQKHTVAPAAATDWFYQLCTSNDYVKVDAIQKNVAFTETVADGNELEITINLSKPEKDPKAIAAAAHDTAKKYPQCALCLENEGYLGRLGQAARSNHRIIRLNVGGHSWGMQYSPYAYFNEHCIFLDTKHEPMKIDQQTLINLVEIERQFPHYFVGSNADLPIVGGSMLAHEHYQGGRHVFPMMKAKIKQELDFPAYPAVQAGVVDWPMSDIRLRSEDTNQLIQLGTHIMAVWNHYDDASLQIQAVDAAGTRHHTVTPIMHREGAEYVLDLVLRDNNTTDQYPLGIFHPHQKLWHIKKENIGLIEVMGRAILPARLKDELHEVKQFWLNAPNQIATAHLPWAKEVAARRAITAENVDQVLHEEVAQVFSNVLADAGVFKNDPAGEAGWRRFLQNL